jgi:CheY-like chemotaxis protein
MKVLVAEDDPDQSQRLQSLLGRRGYEVLAVGDGMAAWQVLQEQSPLLGILDWVMPGLSGLEVCRKARQLPAMRSSYLLLLTARANPADIVTGLEAGADDYLTKPFSGDELHARLQIGQRILTLQQCLGDRVRELECALSRLTLLEGLLPICMYCKRIRDERSWLQVEAYISRHSKVRFSHGICPDCYKDVVQPDLQERAAARGDATDPATQPVRADSPPTAAESAVSGPHLRLDPAESKNQAGDSV